MAGALPAAEPLPPQAAEPLQAAEPMQAVRPLQAARPLPAASIGPTAGQFCSVTLLTERNGDSHAIYMWAVHENTTQPDPCFKILPHFQQLGFLQKKILKI